MMMDLPSVGLQIGQHQANVYKIKRSITDFYVVCFITIIAPVPRRFESSEKEVSSRILFGRDIYSNYRWKKGEETFIEDVIMCCIPVESLMEYREGPYNNVEQAFQQLLRYEKDFHKFDIRYSLVTQKMLYPWARKLMMFLNSLDTLFFPLMEDAIINKYYFERLQRIYKLMGKTEEKINQLLSLPLKSPRSQLMQTIMNYTWSNDEDLDMVKTFLEDPMDEDAFEHLAEYIFPTLIEQGELPSNFPLNYSEFSAFLTNFSDYVLDNIGGLTPTKKYGRLDNEEAYLKKAFALIGKL